MSDSLARKSFWTHDYLPNVQLPWRPSKDLPFERCLMQALAASAPVEPDATVLELGCAPGRWMIFYHERFGARVTGIEYTTAGAELTRANLRAADISGVVHEIDFSEFAPGTGFDLVLSLGFIEHFPEVNDAFARHVRLVKPGGRLAVGVPNFQGINRVLQRWFDPAWLELHNLDAMGHRNYIERAARSDVSVVSVDYLGGFDPDVISTRVRGRKLLAPLWHLRHRGRGDALNAWWLSSYLLMVFERSN